MRHGGNISRRGGLTLIELLLGLMIGSMIAGSCAVVFATAIRSWEQGGEARRAQQSAHAIVALMERHLRSAMPPESRLGGAVFQGEDLGDGETHGHRLILFSTSPGRFPRSAPRSDCALVEIEFDPLDGRGLTMRIDAVPGDDPEVGGYRVTLERRVVGLRVRYHDGEEWLDEWFERRLPLAVEFTIALAGFGDEPGADVTPALVARRLVTLPLGEAADNQLERQLRERFEREGGASAGGGDAP